MRREIDTNGSRHQMVRIVAIVNIENFSESGPSIKLDALVDTGASYLTLQSVCRSRVGTFASEQTIELQTATQETLKGTVCGPVQITSESFRPIYNELIFLDMKPDRR